MILKFESGGIPFVEYTPLNFNTASNYGSVSEESKTKRGSSDSKESGKLTEKDLLMAIKDLDALPSDSAQLYDLMVNFVRMLEMGFGDADPSMLATQFIRMLQHMKDSVYRKNAFEEAYKNVKENNGLNEYAVTDTGDIVVASSDGGIKFASIEQVLSGEYKPLTNADLLRLRAESYAGNDTLTQIVSNGIGMEKITELINTAMKTLGSDENKIEGYTRSPELESILLLRNKVRLLSNNPNLTDELRQGLIQELLMTSESGVQEQGLYKFTNLDRNSQFQIKAALNYIYASLPLNARTILELRSNGNGLAMIMLLLLSTANTTHQLDWDIIENANGVKPGTKESADSLKLDPVKGFILGRGFLKETEINIGTSKSFVVNGRYSTLVDKSGNPLMPNSTLLDVMGSAFQGELDFNSAIMGGELISGDRSKVLINDATIIRVDLPIDVKSALKGIIKPDLAMLKRVEDAEADIKVRNITNEEQINKIYEDNELPPKFIKKNGKWEGNNAEWTSFAVIGAAAEETAFEDPDLLTLLTPITSKGKKEEMAAIFKKQDKDYSYSDNFFSKTGFYKGQIFIPLRDNLVSASYSSGNYFNLKDSEEADRKQFLQKAYVKPQEE